MRRVKFRCVLLKKGKNCVCLTFYLLSYILFQHYNAISLCFLMHNFFLYDSGLTRLYIRANKVNKIYLYRKLIQFGLKNKLIRRLHGYPVKLPSETKTVITARLELVMKFLNGTHSLDDISCKSGTWLTQTLHRAGILRQ